MVESLTTNIKKPIVFLVLNKVWDNFVQEIDANFYGQFVVHGHIDMKLWMVVFD